MNTLQRRLDRLEQATDVNRPGFCVVVVPNGASSKEKDGLVFRALGREPMSGDYFLIIGGIE